VIHPVIRNINVSKIYTEQSILHLAELMIYNKPKQGKFSSISIY